MALANLYDWGIQFILSWQSGADWLIVPMKGFTFTGNIEFYLLLLPILYWNVDRRLGVRLGVFLLLSIVINNLFKMIVHSPRPYWVDTHVHLWADPELFFGLPSGHAQNAVVMWGLLALEGRRAWGWVAAFLLALLTGLSRIYLGVHFPSDVLAGWLLGLLVLWGALGWEMSIVHWLQRYRPTGRLLLLFTISLLLTASGLLVSQLVQMSWSMPAEWAAAALAVAGVAPSPFSLHDIVTATGALWGLSAGALLCTLWADFSTQAPLKAKLLRFVLGAIGVLLLWQGLDKVFALLADEESPLGYLLRYLRYSAVGIWVGLLAPMLFLRFKLAKPAVLSPAVDEDKQLNR